VSSITTPPTISFLCVVVHATPSVKKRLSKLVDAADPRCRVPLYVFRWSDRPFVTEANLRDDNMAWSEAVSSIGQLLRDVDGKLSPHGLLTLDVFDERGALVASISVDAVRRVETSASRLRP
jgi:hypothetical protein